MSEEKKVVRKPIATAADAGKYMAKYYYELDNAAQQERRKSPGVPVWDRRRSISKKWNHR